MRLHILAALGALAAMPALAGGNICWFDHVSADGDRLVLHFSPNASLRLWGSGGRYEVQNGVIRQAASDGTWQPVDVSLTSGESMAGSTMPEDSCTYAVSERDGKRGLLITASNNAFGQHTSATIFLLPE